MAEKHITSVWSYPIIYNLSLNVYRDIAEFFKALIFVVAITGISMECFKLIDLACNLLIANTKPLMQDVNQRTHYTICLLVFSSKLKMLDGWKSAHKTQTNSHRNFLSNLHIRVCRYFYEPKAVFRNSSWLKKFRSHGLCSIFIY